MAGTIYHDSNLDIIGGLKVSSVPNSTGSIVTWNNSTNVFGLRTNAQIIADLGLQGGLINGLHTLLNGNKIDVSFDTDIWVKDKLGRDFFYLGSTGSNQNDTMFKRGTLGGNFKWLEANGNDLMSISNGGVLRVNQLAGAGNRLLQADLSGSIFATNIDPDDIATETWVNANFARQNGNYQSMTVGNSTLWNGQTYFEASTYGVVSHLMSFDPQNNIWRKADKTTTVNWLGINTSWNLQQVTLNGATTTIPSTFNGIEVGFNAGGYRALSINEPLGILDSSHINAQKILTGGLLASDNYADAGLIPVNGIYSKGTIATSAHGTSADWNAKLGNRGIWQVADTAATNPLGVTYWATTTGGFIETYGTSLHLKGDVSWHVRLDIGTGGGIELWQGINSTTMVNQGTIPLVQRGSTNWDSNNLPNPITLTQLNTALGNYVNKAGDTMSGGLNLPLANLIGDNTFLKIGKTLSVSSGDVSNWTFAKRNDTLFGEHVNDLSFWGDRVGGYYVPLIFRNNGDVILSSGKNAISGNVGIGTTNPQAKLHVEGNAIVADATASNHAVNLGQLNTAISGLPTPIYYTGSTGVILVGNDFQLNASTLASLALANSALQVETDPIFTASVAYGITSSDITNWNSKTSNLGTVTGITAGTGLAGGTINTSGTISLNSATLNSLALANTAVQPHSMDFVKNTLTANDANLATDTIWTHSNQNLPTWFPVDQSGTLLHKQFNASFATQIALSYYGGIGFRNKSFGNFSTWYKIYSTMDFDIANYALLSQVPNAPNNGTFTVQGTGALTGSGSTSADATANTTADLDLTNATKNDIQKGVDAYNTLPSIVEGLTFNSVPTVGNYNISIDTKKTVINVTDGVLGANVDIGRAPYVGYELAINGCNEWSINLTGDVQDTCLNQGNIVVASANGRGSLFWWDGSTWVQVV